MKNNKSLDLNDLPALLGSWLRRFSTYKGFAFFLLVAVFYGFILWRINTYSNTPASQNEEAAQTATQPHIDPSVVEKMQSLQDNSVSIQSLFDQARQNPFHE